MAIYFRGAGPGTYSHVNDARAKGFTAKSPHMGHSADRTMHHITQTKVGTATTVASSYISLTNSALVARTYALVGVTGFATATNPGYVYEVEIDEMPGAPKNVQVIDPVKVIAASLPDPPTSIPYQHDGYPGILLGIVLPRLMA